MAQEVKNLLANAGDTGLIPGFGRSPEGENGNTLQYSYLGNPTDRGASQVMVHGGHKESDMTEYARTFYLAFLGKLSLSCKWRYS